MISRPESPNKPKFLVECLEEPVVFASSSKEVSRNRDRAQWEHQVSEWKVHLGATNELASLEPWTSLPGLRLAGVPATLRVKEILNCLCMEVLGGARATQKLMQKDNFHSVVKAKMSGYICDLSQNPCRHAYTNAEGINKCMTTSSILYAFDRDRVILPLEMMLIQGHKDTLRIPPSTSPNELHDLAAMGISLPNLACIFLAIWLQLGL